MKFFNQAGKIALGSRLRYFSETITEDAEKIFELYGVFDFSPKWFPVFYTLWSNGPTMVTEIAEKIGHSQPSVTKIVNEMIKAKLIEKNLNTIDRRKRVVQLSKQGEEIAIKFEQSFHDLDLAIDGIIAESTLNLWNALAEWELLLEQKSLLKRVQEQKKLTVQKHIQIVTYQPKYKEAFKQLNEEWITKYFVMEDVDREELDNPESYVLEKGGEILVALDNGNPIGVCALVKMNGPEYQYELSKLAVSPLAQGKGVGRLLVQAIIDLAKKKKCTKLFLQSNTVLGPAINLYYNVGFAKVSRPSPLYERVNIQMELDLNPSK